MGNHTKKAKQRIAEVQASKGYMLARSVAEQSSTLMMHLGSRNWEGMLAELYQISETTIDLRGMFIVDVEYEEVVIYDPEEDDRYRLPLYAFFGEGETIFLEELRETRRRIAQDRQKVLQAELKKREEEIEQTERELFETLKKKYGGGV